MFGPDFFPTPADVIEKMLMGLHIAGKNCFEPQGGSGFIVDQLLLNGAASVISCEIEPSLKKILATKCKVINDDFFKVQSHDISHIDNIVMNPPFSNGVDHILHAWDIAPPGCTITALCNQSNIDNAYSANRKRLSVIITENGQTTEKLGDCFSKADRQTDVKVALIRLQKPGTNYNQEFEGFFLDDEPEEKTGPGIMPYNVVRDLVNRYVEACKIYDQQLETAVKINELISEFFSDSIGFQCTKEKYQANRNEFKKDLQFAGWMWIFNKMDMAKYATKGLKEDINKFVQQQTGIPFTMKNIYKMLEIVGGTQKSRMDKAIVEVFDWVTSHCAENKYNAPGWKTNSHFLVGKKFIIDSMCYQDQRWHKGESKIQTDSSGNFERIEDLLKALCYITGDSYDDFCKLDHFIRLPYKVLLNGKFVNCGSQYSYAKNKLDELHSKGNMATIQQVEPIYGEWFEWSYFKVKAFKKGTMHFEFKDDETWAKLNQNVARIKGYPLFEGKEQTAYQDRNTGRAKQSKKAPSVKTEAKVLYTVKVA